MLKKLNDINYLNELSNNIEELNNVIIETKGLVLSRLAENKIFPNINIMLKDLNIYKVKFIVENYSLNAEESIKIAAFSNKEIPVDQSLNFTKVEWTEEEIIDYLKKDKRLPNNVFITPDLFRKNKEFFLQLSDDDENYDLLKKSYSYFTDKEILEFKDYFKNRIGFLNSSSLLSKGRKTKDFYRELILTKKRQELSDFKNYEFENSDKELLIDLIKNKGYFSLRKSYANFSSIRGVSNLIDKYDFFELTKNFNFDAFSIEEIKENIDFFQDIILEKKGYNFLTNILDFKIDDDTFKVIFNESFFKKFYNDKKSLDVDVNIQYKENSKDLIEKIKHIGSVLLDLQIKKQIDNEDSTYFLFNILSEIEAIEKKYGLNMLQVKTEESISFKNKSKLFYEMNLYDKLNNKSFLDLQENIRIINNGSYIYSIFNEKKENKFITINGFLALVQTMSNISNYKDLNLMQDLVRDVYKELAKDKSNHYFLEKIILKQKEDKYLEQTHKSLLQNLYLEKRTKKFLLKEKNNDYNILDFHNIELKKASQKLINFIYHYDKSILNKINDEKLVINNDILINIVKDLDNNDEKDIMINFLKNYVNLHQEQVYTDKNLITHFLSSKNQPLFFPYKNSNFENLFKQMIEFLTKTNKLKEINSNIANKYDDFNDSDEEEIRVEDLDGLIKKAENLDYNNKNDCYQLLVKTNNISNLENSYLKEFNSLSSYESIDNAIKDIVKKHDFKTLLLLKENKVASDHMNNLVTYINNIDFKTLNILFDNQDFKKLFLGLMNYDSKTSVALKGFSEKENEIIALKILELFNNNDYPEKIFYFFDKSNREFIKKFAIEHMPLRMIYGYKFFYNDDNNFTKSKSDGFIQSEITNEELITIFLNLENKNGFFSCNDINASYDSFINRAIFDHKDKEDGIEKYLNLLNMAKNHPKFYIILLYDQIFKEGLEYGRDYKNDKDYLYKTSDEAVNAFFVKHVDFDIVLKGINELIDEMEKRKIYIEGNNYESEDVEMKNNMMNYKVANSVIMRVIFDTYYQNNDEYLSYLDEGKTLKLIKLLYTRSPTCLIERNAIGSAKNLNSFFDKHIENFMDIKEIENFIIPEYYKANEYFSLTNNYTDEKNGQFRRCEQYIDSIINKMLSDKNITDLEYLHNMFDQFQFYNEELKYSFNESVYNGKTIQILEEMINNQIVKKLNTIIHKVKLERVLPKKEVGKKVNKL